MLKLLIENILDREDNNMAEWIEKTLGEVTAFITKGIPPKYVDKENQDTVCVLNQKCNRNFEISYVESRLHNMSLKKVPSEKMLHAGDVLINSTGTGTAGRVAQIFEVPVPTTIDGHMILIRPTDEIDTLYYGYAIKGYQKKIESLAEGSTGQTEINRQRLQDEIIIRFPKDKHIQKSIGIFLLRIDEKIKNNEQINNNLEQQAQAIFDNMFPNISIGESTIGDTITPKRGKSLLSKNAVIGNVPVVAGGLEPSTYHNVANTIAPVLAISASGANAGYVSLWNIPIWSSDSSFIDSSMTDDVYFWYVLLKKRQKEIYDAQTGSAQPHIYPQHIASMPIANLNVEEVRRYTSIVTPIFERIGHNKEENMKLAKTRDTLLPKLMSGEPDVSDIDL